MTPGETRPGLDALIADLAETPEERRLMAQAAMLLAYAPESLAPCSSLRDRVLAAIPRPSRPATYEHERFYFAHGSGIEWRTYPNDNKVQDLYRDGGVGASVVRMPPNTLFPAHNHDFIEDLFLIEGDAWVAGVHMTAGDYCRSPVGTAHVDIRSGARGAVAVVVSR